MSNLFVNKMNKKINNKGFTLLEVSIALVILAFLSYTITLGVKATRDYDAYSENKVYLENVRVALLTFVQSNGYLPCPDTDSTMDGVENRTGGVCTSKNGKLPYKMLGVAQGDAWGEVLYYSVNNKADNTAAPLPIDDPVESASYFNNTSAPLFTLNTEPVGVTKGGGNYSVCSENSTSANCETSTCPSHMLECAAIAVVVSFGKNGADTWAKYTAGNVNLLDSAEKENADDDNYFWKSNGSNVSGQEYDDQLIWLTGYDVKYALLKSERGLQ